MARNCDNPLCHAGGRLGRLAFWRHRRPFHLHDMTCCSRQCLITALDDLLRVELLKIARPRIDLKKSRLGALLLAEGLITRDQLEAALDLQQRSGHRPLGQCLVELGVLTEDQLTRRLSEQERLPWLPQERSARTVSVGAAMPLEAVRLARAVPYTFNLVTRDLSLACLAPVDVLITAAVGRVLNCRTVPFLVSEDAFRDLVQLVLESTPQPVSRVHPETHRLVGPVDIAPLAEHIANLPTVSAGGQLWLALMRDSIWLRTLVGPTEGHDFIRLDLVGDMGHSG